MSSELIVMTFRSQRRAETVLEAIRAMRKRSILCLGSVVVATKDPAGEITLRPGQAPAAAGEERDTQMLLALANLIMCPPTPETVAAITDRGMDSRFMSEIAASMEGESSALFVLARENRAHDAGETRNTLALFQGRLHQTNLPPEVDAYFLEKEI